MSIDFEIPAEAKAIREKVRQWVHDECIPAQEKIKDKASFEKILGELRSKARAQGLWMPFVPKEYGGMGLGPWPTLWSRWSWARATSARCR